MPPTTTSNRREGNGHETVAVDEKPADVQVSAPKSAKFWSVFLALCLLGLSTALEATIVATALPTIIQSIDIGSRYIWVGNAFLLASTVIQPFIGQIADIFGRRWPLIVLTVCFILGSGLAGGANGPGLLIGGRAVQGLGAGGILVLIDVVVSDLVPLQERAKFMGLVRITGALGSAIGPIVGGAIANVNWRWCFYLNLITGGLALVYLVLFLRVEHKPDPWRIALSQIDYLGVVIFMGSMTSLLLGLIMGGVVFPWKSANIIVPIVIGIIGWIVFHVYESTRLCKHPMVPTRLFKTRTSSAGFFMAFDGALLLYWVIWFLPVYFQGVWGASPLQSGVDQLPLNMFLVPSGIVAGGMISKSGKYRAHHFVGFSLISVGVGLFTLLDAGSHKAEWACFQIVASVGLGVILVSVLPAIQSALSDVDIAKTTATYAFVRSLGGIWGVTIPSVIFNSRVDDILDYVTVPTIQHQMANGKAYGFASKGGVEGLTGAVKDQVLRVYSDALKTVWQIGIAFSVLGFLATLLVKQYDMSRKNETNFGLQQSKEDGEAVVEKAESKTKSEATSFIPKQCTKRTSQLLASMLGGCTTTIAKKVLRERLPAIEPGSIIHDNGCGSGTVTREILDMYPELVSSFPSTFIHSTDINTSFIEDFKQYTASRGWRSTVHPAAMPAEELSLEQSLFTHSFTHFVIAGAKDPAKATSEVLRTLAPGGVAIMTTFMDLPHSRALDRTREQLYGEHGMPHIKPEWSNPSHLETLLKDAGFVRVSRFQMDSEMVHESMDSWTQKAWSWMGAPGGGWRKEDEDNWDENREMFGAECIKAGFKVDEDGTVRVDHVANVVIGYKP